MEHGGAVAEKLQAIAEKRQAIQGADGSDALFGELFQELMDGASVIENTPTITRTEAYMGIVESVNTYTAKILTKDSMLPAEVNQVWYGTSMTN